MEKYEELLEELKTYFCELLIIQYRQAPKNREFISLLVDLVFSNNILSQIYDLTVNINDSIGSQLDVVGKWLGTDRFYAGLDLFDRKYFSLVKYSNIRQNSYNENQGGFSNYTNFDTLVGGFITYLLLYNAISAVNKLGDNYFRKLLKLKSIKNSINFTKKEIDNAIYEWSEGKIYTTWDKMKVIYNYNQDGYKFITIAKSKDLLIAPTGCTIELNGV